MTESQSQLVPITCYRCTRCNRIYEELPNRCVCDRVVYMEGEQFGPFLILGTDGEGLNKKIKVRCLMCGDTTSMVAGNIKRQHSCGCKPRHIEVVAIHGMRFVYKCRKCNLTTNTEMPVATYCCEETDDELE